MTLLERLMRVYYGVVDPSLVQLRKKKRLHAWHPEYRPGTLALSIAEGRSHGGDGALALRRFLYNAQRYDMRFDDEASGKSSRKATPMMFDVSACADEEAFRRLLHEQSRRNLSKIRKASREGYAVKQFALPMHVHDVHAVKTSMAFRSGGPVLARWLLKPDDLAAPATEPLAPPVPECPTHWTTWWGVFLPEPGHMNGPLAVHERLVAYTKLTRCGDTVHYLDLMGHKAHLEHGVMLLMHAQIVSWLIAQADPCAAGVKAVWYGALEHGRPGLNIWKKRAGFAPVRVRLTK